jgi:hypothetical protein
LHDIDYTSLERQPTDEVDGPGYGILHAKPEDSKKSIHGTGDMRSHAVLLQSR